MNRPAWSIVRGEGPLVAAAIHDGHDVRPEVRDHLALTDEERLREEDPFTSEWTTLGDTRIVGRRSRFEVDFNRPREKAVYLKPEDAWGLDVWCSPLPPRVVDGSLNLYDGFYREVESLLSWVSEKHGRVVVYDLHSFNHRRGGPDRPPEDRAANPDVNVGTGTMERSRWAPVIDAFIGALRDRGLDGRSLDVRENVKFRGGFFPEWVHTRFPESGCAIAIEVKKFFMDEWTGQPDRQAIADVGRALESTVRPVLDALNRCS